MGDRRSACSSGVSRRVGVGAVVVLLSGICMQAEDWPEWRGQGRLGVWNENGIVDAFPAQGLEVRWRTPVKAGYSGPAVADGRVFLTDFSYTQRPRGIERALAFDEKTGRLLWTREWNVNYSGLSYEVGPRATPTVDGDRVYVLGATGVLQALGVKNGEVLWQKDYAKDYGTDLSEWAYNWGISSAPLVDGNRLICLVGGRPDAKVVAFDKMTGKELWRALAGPPEPGYSQPIIVTAGGARQLIVWHPYAVSSLNPATGAVYWEQPFKAGNTISVATPVQRGLQLLVSSFYTGSLMLSLDDAKPAASVAWQGKSDSEIQTDGLHALVNTPVIDGDYIYGICSYGQLRGLKAKTGERVWETQAVTKERTRWVTAFIVRHEDRYFINNDRGDLIIARLKPEGYQEISRTQLIEPTSPPGNRRQLGAVNWSHPAYANRHIYARNDKEIISASLEAKSVR